MLRKMCICVQENETLYSQRHLTGKVIKRVIINDRTITILECTRCKHRWHYSRKAKH